MRARSVLLVGLLVGAFGLTYAMSVRHSTHRLVNASAAATTSEPTTTATTEPIPIAVPEYVPPPPVVIRYTDNAVLVQALDAAAERLMGRNGYGGYQAFEDEFHAQEREQQTRAQSGESYFTVDPRAEAEAFVNRYYEVDVRAYRTAQAGEAVNRMIQCPRGCYDTTTTTDWFGSP